MSQHIKDTQCRTPQLTIINQPIDAAAGTIEFRIVFTNHGRPFVLQGYPELTAATGPDRTVMRAQREPGLDSPLVSLAAGQSASAYYRAVSSLTKSCPPYGALFVAPPNTEAAAKIDSDDSTRYCDFVIQPVVAGATADRSTPPRR